MDYPLVCLQPRQCTTNWSDLLPDLLTLIMSRVFLSDRCNFKLVCKSWDSIRPIPPPLPPLVESRYFNSPCLMFLNWSNNSWRLFHSVYNQIYSLDFQDLNDTKILFSKDGWLLMSRDLTLFFLNPFTNEKVELPSITCSFTSVCFTAPPTSPNCTIFGISYDGYIEFGLLQVGDSEWKSKTIEKTNRFLVSICPPLYYNGVYYCLDGNTSDIYVFDPRKPHNWKWAPYEKANSDDEEANSDEEEANSDEEEANSDDEEEANSDYEEEANSDDEEENSDDEEENSDDEEEANSDDEEEANSDDEEEANNDDEEEANNDDEEENSDNKKFKYHDLFYEHYLVEVEGTIWGIFVLKKERRVQVKKLDSSHMRWIELENLGNKCLYLSRNGSFAETCTSSSMANKIYFNNFHNESGVLYSLKSGMHHSIEGGFASAKVYSLYEVDYSAWIKPTV